MMSKRSTFDSAPRTFSAPAPFAAAITSSPVWSSSRRTWSNRVLIVSEGGIERRQERLAAASVVHAQIVGMIGGEENERVVTHTFRRFADRPIERDDAIESASELLGMHVHFDHQKEPLRVVRQQVNCAPCGGRHIEAAVEQDHRPTGCGWQLFE
jgi:hypothetical protein